MFKKIRLHPEMPISVAKEDIFKNDTLGFQDGVKRLSSLIENIVPPFTIGIYGDWGSGKTSFMKLLKNHIEKENGIKTSWFNAWEYENEGSLILPLLSQLKEDFKECQAPLFDSTKKIAASLALVGSNVFLKGITAGMVGLDDIEKAFDTYERNTIKTWDKWVDNTRLLKEEFKKLVNNIKEEKQYIAIFIDDLDRCSPENVVKTIENIKNYFSLEGCNCVFILGVDPGILKKGIQARYGSQLISGEEYLEKIINISFNVPIHAIENTYTHIVETANKHIVTEWQKEISTNIETFARLVAGTGFKNPRKLKFLIQRYLFFLSLDERDKYVEDVVIRLIIYKEFFPDAYARKKKNGKVDYIGNVGSDVPYAEKVKVAGKDFADIFEKHELRFLLTFVSPINWLISNVFDRETQEALARENQLRTNTPSEHQKIEKYFSGDYFLKSAPYFQLIDFLFNLGRVPDKK